MKQEELWYLFALITEKLDSLRAWHSQLISQAKELGKQENFYEDKTLQGLKRQLIERKESLLQLFRQKNEIKFHLTRKYIPWPIKIILIISPLLEEYGWGSTDKIEAILQQEESRLLEIEKQLSDLSYLSFDLVKLNQIIEENLIEQIAKINLKNADNYDSIIKIDKAYQILADYSIAERNYSANRDRVGYLNILQTLNSRVSKMGGTNM